MSRLRVNQSNNLSRKPSHPRVVQKRAPQNSKPKWMTHTPVEQKFTARSTAHLKHDTDLNYRPPRHTPSGYRPPRHVGGFEPTGEQFETNESFTIEEMSSKGQKEAAKAFLYEFDKIKKDEEAKIPENEEKRKEYIKKNENKNLKTGKQRGKENVTLLIWKKKTKDLIKILKEIVKDSSNKFDLEKHNNVIDIVDVKKTGAEVKEQLEACGERGKQLFNYLDNYNLLSRQWKTNLQDTDKKIQKHKEYKTDIEKRTDAYKDKSKNSSDILSGSYKNKGKISKKMKKELKAEEANEEGE
jgi:hypothetical protein